MLLASVILCLPTFLMVIIGVVFLILGELSLISAGSDEGVIKVMDLLLNLAVFVQFPLSLAFMMRLVSQFILSPLKPLRLREAFASVKKRLPSLLFATLLVALPVLPVMLFFGRPFVWMVVLTATALTFPAIMVERLGGWAGLRRGLSLARRVWGTLLLAALIHFGLPVLFELSVGFEESGDFISILLLPLVTIMLALAYLKARQLGGEPMDEVLASFEEEENLHSAWQARLHSNLQSNTITKSSITGNSRYAAPSLRPNLPEPIAQEEKKSALPWLAIGGGVLALLVVGIMLIIGLRSYMGNKDAANATPKATASGGDEKKGGDTKSDSSSVVALRDDFSEIKWPTFQTKDGSSLYQDGMYIMQLAEGFIVNYAPAESTEYSTNGAKSVSITTKLLDGDPPIDGFGLVLHGGETDGNEQYGYAFLINIGDKPMISVVEIEKGTPTYLVEPKSAPMIQTGGAENRLTVKIDGKKLDFYVNEQLTASITDKKDLPGRVGLLINNGGGRVGFDNLEISK